MSAPSPFAKLIKKLTVNEIVSALGSSYQTVASWKTRKRGIPVNHWPAIIEIAKRKDIPLTLDLLLEWRSRKGKRGDS